MISLRNLPVLLVVLNNQYKLEFIHHCYGFFSLVNLCLYYTFLPSVLFRGLKLFTVETDPRPEEECTGEGYRAAQMFRGCREPGEGMSRN